MKIYLSSKGIRPDIDNSPIINRVLETAKPGSTLVFKDGRFPIHSTLMQKDKLNWEGADDTNIVAAYPITLARITGGYKGVISRVNFIGGYSIYDNSEKPDVPGVQIFSLTRMIDCMVRNAWGSGIVVSADVHSSGGNASKSKFENIDIIECKGRSNPCFLPRISDVNFFTDVI